MFFYIAYVVLALVVSVTINYVANKRLEVEDGLHDVIINERDAERIVASF